MPTVQGRMRAAVARVVVAACVLQALSISALALNPSLDVNQYAHTAWKVRDSFSKGAINAIAQALDGYIWLGTDFGLLRRFLMKRGRLLVNTKVLALSMI